ncbi:hypothetical protein LOTGIDRAFT_142860, partial [Lottia gigantea]
ILPCLSVRSALDLYLLVQNYPPGSEVIMSAINIPQIAEVVKHHNLTIIPLDISIETVSPKINLLESLITPKTVAVLVAHLYGKRIEMSPILKIAKTFNISVIEDCAEYFQGLNYLSDPESDVALYSFGSIKFFTSFGGGVAIIKNQHVHHKMMEIQNKYPVQSRQSYSQKVFKLYLWHKVQTSPTLITLFIKLCLSLGYDYQDVFVKMLRGFPHNLIDNIRYQPSTSLLSMMLHRQSTIDLEDLAKQRTKGLYVLNRLPPEIETVGRLCDMNNFWLFPILVENPDLFVATIRALGVDAYRGATQLNLIEEDRFKSQNGEQIQPKTTTDVMFYPHEAKYLIDHVVYLPVHKHVPYPVLDEIIKHAKNALNINKNHFKRKPAITSKL